MVSSGEDPVSPVLLTSLCRDQLVLALRLFQSQSFLMFPRERRHEGRARAYLALIGRQAGAPAPYVLQGHQVTRFLEFARSSMYSTSIVICIGASDGTRWGPTCWQR